MLIWYLSNNPITPILEKLAFFILLFSGSIEKLNDVRKSVFSRFDLKKIARCISQLSNMDALRSVSEKSVSCRLQFRKQVFFNFSLLKTASFSTQFSKSTDSRKGLHSSNWTPNNLQLMNLTSFSVVFFRHAKLKSQPSKVHSLNTTFSKSTLWKLQFTNLQSSYSSFGRLVAV